MKIFVDDERQPEQWKHYSLEWHTVKNFEQFKELVLDTIHQNIDIEIISFDHDLGENQLTGYDCAKWLTEQYIVIPEIWSHSMNTPGKMNILTLMKNWQKFNNLQENTQWIQLQPK